MEHKLSLTLLEAYHQQAYCGAALGDRLFFEGEPHTLTTPIDGGEIGRLHWTTPESTREIVQSSHQAFKQWRSIPAPLRGQLVRRIGEIAREHKTALAEVITFEAGKTIQEAQGEVQEWIDVCDFAVGLSRQLHGLTIASERPEHRMMEQWHPLGVIGVITAFNFPMAVWAWNAMLALVCGNTIVWKPSEKAPLCALACHAVLQQALSEFPEFPKALSAVVMGNAAIGKELSDNPLIPLVSATGSAAMGKQVAQSVAGRLGRSLLELSGNNAMILSPSADLELAVRAILFSAVGTSGQRCTTLRRLIVHKSIAKTVVERLERAMKTLSIGDPREVGVHLGPLVDEAAVHAYEQAIEQAKREGGELIAGGGRAETAPTSGFYVKPALICMPEQTRVVKEETFAPILYVIAYDTLEEAIAMQNDVKQGLSSSIFTNDMREAERFLSAQGSDCGIANVNIGTSGAEIGGAFGGEKDTGGGRESGSDAWKNYMRRATNTVNYGSEIPLAQGIKFDV
jgi:aldehyde dehydrogenase (NAD+)